MTNENHQCKYEWYKSFVREDVFGCKTCRTDAETVINQLEAKIVSYRKAYEQAVENVWQGENVILPDLDDMLAWLEEKETIECSCPECGAPLSNHCPGYPRAPEMKPVG